MMHVNLAFVGRLSNLPMASWRVLILNFHDRIALVLGVMRPLIYAANVGPFRPQMHGHMIELVFS